MMLKVGNDYLDFEDTVEVVKRVKTPDTIDSAGDFSYAFEIPLTSKNVKLLKLGVNRSDKIIYNNISAILELNGSQIYFGYLRVESITNFISCSFFSGNNNWINAIQGKMIYDLDLSSFSVVKDNLAPSPSIIATWSNTEGIIYPLIDTGALKNSINKVVNSFIPMVYVKTILPAIFQQNGFKVTGELFNDSLFNTAVVGSPIFDLPETPFYQARSSYVGKTTQSINTTPQLVTFNLETFPFYDGDNNNFASNRYTSDLDQDVSVLLELNLDASVQYAVELRRNGSTIDTLEGTSDTISTKFNSGLAITLQEDDYIEVWMSVSSGSVNIESGSLKIKIIRFNKVYPQFLLGNMTQTDFIYNIFTMFNVIASFDQFTNTVTLNLFKNISSKPEQDLSAYISEYDIDFIEVIGEVSKRNLFTYESTEDEDNQTFNDQAEIQWGGGVIEPNNDYISGDNRRTVNFVAPFNYFNETFGANLANFGLVNAQVGEAEDAGNTISSVTDSGGNALFTTSADHGLDVSDSVYIIETNTGQYIGIGLVNSVPTTTTFTLFQVPFESGPAVTGTVVRVDYNENNTTGVFIGTVIPSMPTSDFMNGTFKYVSVEVDEVAYLYFLKTDINKPIDSMRESLAFGNQFGYNQITLLDKYYAETERYFNDPVKIKAVMNIPFKVFNDLDFSRPVRVKTKDFDIKSFILENEGWVSSNSPCLFELVKLS